MILFRMLEMCTPVVVVVFADLVTSEEGVCAQIQVGDIIIDIDGQDCAEMSLPDIQRKMAGPVHLLMCPCWVCSGRASSCWSAYP
eukprot:1420700-Rhodomonas_salina.2